MDIRNRRFLMIGFVLFLPVLFWFYNTPRFAFDNLRQAVYRGDQAAIERGVDFQALRSSVKANMRYSIRGRVKSGVGRLLVSAALDPAVDKIVSPFGLTALIEGILPLEDQNRNEMMEKTGQAAADPKPGIEMIAGYEGINLYSVRFISKNGGTERLALVFTREGLISWKLSALRFT